MKGCAAGVCMVEVYISQSTHVKLNNIAEMLRGRLSRLSLEGLWVEKTRCFGGGFVLFTTMDGMTFARITMSCEPIGETTGSCPVRENTRIC